MKLSFLHTLRFRCYARFPQLIILYKYIFNIDHLKDLEDYKSQLIVNENLGLSVVQEENLAQNQGWSPTEVEVIQKHVKLGQASMTVITRELEDLRLTDKKSRVAVKSMFYRTKEKVETHDILKDIADLETEISKVKLKLQETTKKLEAEQAQQSKYAEVIASKTKLDSELGNEVGNAKMEAKTFLLNSLGKLRKKIDVVILTYMEDVSNTPPTTPPST
ncbi:hypothetical protein A2U01_0005229 [Trifolium medium]|uniref:Uncharacterized protein n=1 Tax=Trifolium medium TaxID=97028 RepID=A0A392MA57_9FABA|nr:hypothetical protein [Trifolium medium]